MGYFNKSFTEFFSQLRKNNKKEWFDENRKTYEKQVKEPFKRLVNDMISFASEHDPEVMIEPKHAMFRINRDIRFSKDKTPYQTHVSAFIAPGGKNSSMPGFYFQLSDQKVWLGGGVYAPDKEGLYKIRMEIMHSGDVLEEILNDSNFKDKYGNIQGEKNKVLPSEFKESARLQPLLFNKQFYFMAELDPSIIISDMLFDTMTTYYEAALPLNLFLKTALTD